MQKNTVATMAFWRCEVTLDDLAVMPVRAAFIVMMRSNLLGVVWAYSKLGWLFDVTTERIRQIEQAAMAKACRKRHNRATRDDEARRERSVRKHYPED